ncbi:hypothetical protein EI546_02930 [Aequorivita sp. H23M31]|uniref:GDYXXLXY domain-containing protein n=1 Tax=Aequorivita ciconiae TaxID=2494375 RepID=A0A410G0E8_9FLAO|nr:GDYXXLXY domain-containing protein [Aequorivita sp. H23M31]QAA80746.1 hypothetical protein EI546_02930 [Aequorivita sp. H23M31]
MTKKQILITAFIVVAMVQLLVPAKMIWDKENILKTGKEFKFEVAPVDPTDLFRGKYIILQFKENSFPVKSTEEWLEAKEVYVILKPDSEGFAKIQSISKVKPDDNKDYVKAKVDYLSGMYSKNITISYPFHKFYMEETKAPEAEWAYHESARDSTQNVYALVAIKKGEAVIKNVFIDGIPIKEVVERNREENHFN